MKRNSKYRKHVENSVLNEFPEPKEDEEIVVVMGSRGGNILAVKQILSSPLATNEESLCILPAKFRKLVWVRRGTVLLVQRAEQEKGKIRFTVNSILFHEQVKHLIKQGLFTQLDLDTALGVKQDESISLNALSLTEKPDSVTPEEAETETESEDYMGDVFVNTNRVGHNISEKTS